MNKGIKIGLLIVFFLSFLFSSFSEDKKNEWVVAVSQFKFENAKPLYASYAKTVPGMFLTYLDGSANRLESLSEKKMRALMKASSKKLKLIKERIKLIQEMDNLFLSIDPENIKKVKLKKLKKQIRDKEIEIEKSEIELKIADNKFYDYGDAKAVALWKDGTELYKYDENRDLSYALQKDGISAIVLGTLKDASGYLIIKASLETGLNGVKSYSFTEAGRYADAEEMVKKIAIQIYTVIQNTREVKVFFDVSPKNAKVYIDGNIVNDFSKPISLHEGTYSIEAAADEYITSAKTILLSDKKYYKLKIKLKREDSTILAFNIPNEPDIFFKTRYYGSSPMQMKLPYQTNVVEFEKNGVRTYVLLDKEKIPISEASKNMVVQLNQKETKKLVERQRKVMYWSLGALYAVLPAYLILNSVYSDRKMSMDDGRLAHTPSNEKYVKNLSVATTTMQSVAIVAGLNYLAQLITYLVFSDRAIPRQPKITSIDIPKHDILDVDESTSVSQPSEESIKTRSKEENSNVDLDSK